MIHAGHRFGFRPSPQRVDGEGGGALEQAVARWVLAHGGDARLAETAARWRGLGLWADPRPKAPWQWRKQHRRP